MSDLLGKVRLAIGERSYSQEGEDRILARLFESSGQGFYVDVGAHHPMRFSNTFLFYRRGWRGVNIDATPGSMRLFDRYRSRDTNIESGVGLTTGVVPFYVFNEPALNTFDRELSETAPMDLQPGPVVVAHPAAIVLALLMLRLQKAVKPKTAVVTIFEPASERGRKGLDELHQQTVSILSFQSLPKEIFDAQVAFNVLAKFGAASTPTLESTEKKIIDHFQKAVRGHVAIPSLVLLHASVFHGHAFSLYLESEDALAIEDVANSLSGEHVQVVKANEESPTNVDVAGQDDVVVSLRPDSQKKNGLWIWAAADNLRVTALNAIGAAEQLVASRPRGKVQ